MSVQFDDIQPEHMADLEPGVLGWLKSMPSLCSRIKIESLYEQAVIEQQEEVKEVKREELLHIPKDLDYFAYD